MKKDHAQIKKDDTQMKKDDTQMKKYDTQKKEEQVYHRKMTLFFFIQLQSSACSSSHLFHVLKKKEDIT